jgi:hypothetical protein
MERFLRLWSAGRNGPAEWLREVAGCRRGGVGLVFALSLPLVIGGAAFGAESSYWYFKDLKLQAAADAAAYAAAIERRAGRPTDSVRAAALAQATANGFNASTGTLVVNTPPTSGPNQNPRAVEVLLAEPQQRFFTRIFSTDRVTARARSVAVFQNAGNACVLALDPSASAAASFSGSSNLTLTGCSVMANSVASNAINMQGAARLTTTCLISVGGVSTTNGVNMTNCETPVTQAPPVADPFAELPEPSTSGTCQSGNGAVLSPGKYCGLSLSGNVTLQPGVYVISGGNFRINANANVTGTGVTFYLTGGSRTQFNGNATMNLTAPSSGTYSGVLFFGDRASLGGRNTFNGTADSRLTGAIYFPSQPVEYLGDFSGLNGCTQVVGRTVEWSGNTSVSVDCTGYGMSALPAMQLIRLSE